MEIITEGIVVKEVKTGESSRYISILTKDRGVISAFAKGSRNLKSRLVSATSLLSYCDFELYENKGKYYVDKASSKKIFHNIQTDIETLSLTMYFSQVIVTQGATEENTNMLLRLFLNSLHMLNEKKLSRDAVKFIFEMRFMTLCGYMPDLISCAKGGNLEKAQVTFFDIPNGNLYTQEVLSQEEKNSLIPLNTTELHALRHVIYSDFEKLFAVKFTNSLAKKMNKISEMYLCYHTDRTYQTLDFYKSVLT